MNELLTVAELFEISLKAHNKVMIYEANDQQFLADMFKEQRDLSQAVAIEQQKIKTHVGEAAVNIVIDDLESVSVDQNYFVVERSSSLKSMFEVGDRLLMFPQMSRITNISKVETYTAFKSIETIN